MKLLRMLTAIVLSIMAVEAEPRFRTEPIFPLQSKHVHASSIVECPNGDLLACWFHGSGERTANDVVVQGARKRVNDASWSPVFVMADTQDLPDCNPVLFIDPQERLWLFWVAVVANRWEQSLLKYRRAERYEEEGPPIWSWQDVLVLKPGEGFPQAIRQGFEALEAEEGCWAAYALPYEELIEQAAQDSAKRQRGWMTRIHPLVLPQGRWLLPLYSDGYNLSLIALTDDLGATWHTSAPIVGYGPTQPSLVLRQDGTLTAYMRDEGGPPQRVQVSTSMNQGETWSPPRDIDIPNPSSSLEVLALRDGHWLMIANDTEDGRHRLTALVSDDEGASWKWKRRIEPADPEGRTFEYPSVIQTRDQLIHLTYSRTTSRGRTIQHTTVNTEWLRDRPQR